MGIHFFKPPRQQKTTEHNGTENKLPDGVERTHESGMHRLDMDIIALKV